MTCNSIPDNRLDGQRRQNPTSELLSLECEGEPPVTQDALETKMGRTAFLEAQVEQSLSLVLYFSLERLA